MSAVWDAVYAIAREICPADSLRLTNLTIAAASRHSSTTGRKARWDSRTAQKMVEELSLSSLPEYSLDSGIWNKLAERGLEASHLGASSEGMHSWAAAYQRASTTQKSLGAYATHNAFASALARITFETLPRDRTYRIVDPSVGAGNLLLAALELRGSSGSDGERKRLILSLHGMELDPKARELCCLLIWLAGASAGVSLKQVNKNIVLGNALTRDWWTEQDLFEVLLMNPPWESLRHQVVADEAHADERQATIDRLSNSSAGNPNLPALFTAQGAGDRNLFKAFLELAPHLLNESGRLGALLPAAFASDAGLTDLRKRYFSQFEIERWTSYENRASYFPIDGRYKFGLLAATRSPNGTQQLQVRGFAVEPDEVGAPHIALQREDINLIGRKYHIIPEISQRHELQVLRIVLTNGVPLFEGGALGKVTYRREIDLSLAKAQFKPIDSLRLHNRGDGTFLDVEGRVFVPLLEGRSIGAFDCSQKSWVSGVGRKAVWKENSDNHLASCRPQYVTAPGVALPPRVAICDVTAATNTRTVVATWVPETWRCGNTAPVLEFENFLTAFAGLGILNSMVFDWVARRLTSGLHLNKFILEGFVWPKLTATELEMVAHCAWSICINQPRSGLTEAQTAAVPWTHETGTKGAKPKSAKHAAAVIEYIVSRTLGLSALQLEAIFDPDPSDRRGFWRYFALNSDAASIARLALKLASGGS